MAADPVAERKQVLIDAAEAQETSGDAIEGVWLRRLASLVEHKGEVWMLRSLGGNLESVGQTYETWLLPKREGR